MGFSSTSIKTWKNGHENFMSSLNLSSVIEKCLSCQNGPLLNVSYFLNILYMPVTDSQVGQDCEQPFLVEDVPPHSRGMGSR